MNRDPQSQLSGGPGEMGAPYADLSDDDIAAWEAAYTRFETPEQEINKFVRRLRQLGANAWRPDARIVDLFCGRGNGLHALEKLGFTQLEGVDISARLLDQYRGSARLHQADCRSLPLQSEHYDIVVVQGGLHHLPELPDDLARTLAEIARILKPDGRLVVVEPWLTPFLSCVHAACRVTLLRRLWPKLDALAIMIEKERETYERWLSQPEMVLGVFDRHFVSVSRRFSFGKMMRVDRKRAASAGHQ